MSEAPTGAITVLLQQIQAGDGGAEHELLPIVYAELRKLARARLAPEWSKDVPEATSLVHEAYLRLVGDRELRFENRAHFFGAAGEAMRRILVERARRRARVKHGGGQQRVTLDDQTDPGEPSAEELLALDEALRHLEARDATMGAVVKLRYFAGLSIAETARALDLSERSVSRLWTGARAWLQAEMSRAAGDPARQPDGG